MKHAVGGFCLGFLLTLFMAAQKKTDYPVGMEILGCCFAGLLFAGIAWGFLP